MDTPPLAPKPTDDVTVYLVLNDFGPLGRAYVETDDADANERDVVSNIQQRPVVQANTSGGFQHRWGMVA